VFGFTAAVLFKCEELKAMMTPSDSLGFAISDVVNGKPEHKTAEVKDDNGALMLLKQLKFDPTLISRDIDSRAKLILVIADWRDCAFLFALITFMSAPRATTATIEKMARATIISTKVKALEFALRDPDFIERYFIDYISTEI
jgi:hypothetical protein